MPPTNASPQVLACQDKISRSISCITGVTVRPWRLLEENIEYTTHKKAELGVNGDERTLTWQHVFYSRMHKLHAKRLQ